MPMDGASADRLHAAPWAAFDAAWYAARHAEAREAAGTDPAALEAHYREVGGAQGLSPNRFFDERFYLARHPDVAADVRRGGWPTGFAHYLAHGHAEGRDPHWLFDEVVYRRLSPDLTPEAVAAAGYANAYDHYLRAGDMEGRQASLFLDPAYLIAALPAAEAELVRRTGAFTHFLGLAPGQADRLPLSPYFDAAWYLGRYPDVAEAIARGRWHAALHHYLANQAPTGFDPLLHFSERHYLQANPDVAEAVASGALRNGYAHFLDHGVFELRAPAASLDLAAYVGVRRDAAEAIGAGRVRDAFRHLVTMFDDVLPAAARLAPPLPAEVVLVLGMPRSGAGHLAGRLAAVGLAVPGTQGGGEAGLADGAFEPAEVVALNEAALRAEGSGWHVFLRPGGTPYAALRLREQATMLLARLLAGCGPAVIKDPRLCLVLGSWLDALQDLGVRPRLVVVLREPEAVARSLEARHGFSRAHGRLLWARYHLELATALAARGLLPDALLRSDSLEAGVPALAATLGLPGLRAAEAGSPPPRSGWGARTEAGDPILDGIAEGIRDAGGLCSAIPALEAFLAPAQAQATLLGPLLQPPCRLRPDA
jgi:hypothetical protein